MRTVLPISLYIALAHHMPPKFTVLMVGLTALGVGLYLQIFGINFPVKITSQNKPDIEGFFWPKQKKLSQFDLIDQNNKAYNLENLTGKWNLVFFGYTHCPDICPITMHTLGQVKSALSPRAQIETNFVFISVDGERDTPQHLKTYLEFFDNEFIGATGNKSQIESLTGQLGVPYSIDGHEINDKDYLASHSGALFLISPQGSLASIFQMPYTANEISERIVKIQQFTTDHS